MDPYSLHTKDANDELDPSEVRRAVTAEIDPEDLERIRRWNEGDIGSKKSQALMSDDDDDDDDDLLYKGIGSDADRLDKVRRSPYSRSEVAAAHMRNLTKERELYSEEEDYADLDDLAPVERHYSRRHRKRFHPPGYAPHVRRGRGRYHYSGEGWEGEDAMFSEEEADPLLPSGGHYNRGRRMYGGHHYRRHHHHRNGYPRSSGAAYERDAYAFGGPEEHHLARREDPYAVHPGAHPYHGYPPAPGSEFLGQAGSAPAQGYYSQYDPVANAYVHEMFTAPNMYDVDQVPIKWKVSRVAFRKEFTLKDLEKTAGRKEIDIGSLFAHNKPVQDMFASADYLGGVRIANLRAANSPVTLAVRAESHGNVGKGIEDMEIRKADLYFPNVNQAQHSSVPKRPAGASVNVHLRDRAPVRPTWLSLDEFSGWNIANLDKDTSNTLRGHKEVSTTHPVVQFLVSRELLPEEKLANQETVQVPRNYHDRAVAFMKKEERQNPKVGAVRSLRLIMGLAHGKRTTAGIPKWNDSTEIMDDMVRKNRSRDRMAARQETPIVVEGVLEFEHGTPIPFTKSTGEGGGVDDLNAGLNSGAAVVGSNNGVDQDMALAAAAMEAEMQQPTHGAGVVPPELVASGAMGI